MIPLGCGPPEINLWSPCVSDSGCLLYTPWLQFTLPLTWQNPESRPPDYSLTALIHHDACSELCLLQRVGGGICPMTGATEFTVYMICVRSFYAIFSFQSLKSEGKPFCSQDHQDLHRCFHRFLASPGYKFICLIVLIACKQFCSDKRKSELSEFVILEFKCNWVEEWVCLVCCFTTSRATYNKYLINICWVKVWMNDNNLWFAQMAPEWCETCFEGGGVHLRHGVLCLSLGGALHVSFH